MADSKTTYFNSYFLDALLATGGNVDKATRMLAVGAFESGAGKHGHSLEHNNHHGVTAGSTWSGPVFKVGSLTFREYGSDLEAFQDWIRFMKKLYPKVYNAKTDAEFVQEMGNATRYHGASPAIYSTGVRQYLTYFNQLARNWTLAAAGGVLAFIVFFAILSTFE